MDIEDSRFVLKGVFTTEFILNKAIISYFIPSKPSPFYANKPVCLVGNITGPAPDLYIQAANSSFIEGTISRLVYINEWYQGVNPFTQARNPSTAFDFFKHLLASNIEDVINYPNQ
jgi:hypothetical protein